MSETVCVVTFPSTYQVLKAEKALKGEIACRLIPVPRQISSDCGLALSFPAHDESRVRELLAAAKVEFEGWHTLP